MAQYLGKLRVAQIADGLLLDQNGWLDQCHDIMTQMDKSECKSIVESIEVHSHSC
jgi:hypothetical protein